MKRDTLLRALYAPNRGSGGYAFAQSPEELEKSFGKPVARLASNENPFGPSPAVFDALKHSLSDVHRYPDQEVKQFQNALRSLYGSYSFVIGAGMDGVIETVIRVIIEPGDKVVIIEPTFSFYKIATEAYHGSVCSVSLRDDFSVDPEAVIQASQGAKLTFLCTPNNPTGTTISQETIEKIAESIDGLLFLDNAYGEFSEVLLTPFDLMKKYDNLVIGRTMSKLYGLAGLRIGYAAVPDWFLPFYEKAATPFAVPVLSARAAIAALLDQKYAQEVRTHIMRWRDYIMQESPLSIVPSSSNFCLIDISPKTGEEAAQFFAERGILVRSCDSFSGLEPHYIRVSIGRDMECERLLEVLHAYAEDIKR
ncbi:MAG: histidinol-phosphate transaminase [Methanomicrobiales archaeon]|jgi:histidinol-phosphate aminotransferase|nr:histidinol-phosphate transaminase [Methanomicrobiales archaeon]